MSLLGSRQNFSSATQWILLVDDEVSIRTLMKQFLAVTGHEIEEAGNAEQALAVLGKRATEPLVTFVDVMMPGTDGLTLARKLRARFKRGRIVVMSGHLSDVSFWPEDLRDVDFMAKPFRLELVLEKVTAARAAQGI
jgi:DNA-binding NtrC family response regulator